MKTFLLLSYLTILPAGDLPDASSNRPWEIEGELRFQCESLESPHQVFYLQLRGNHIKNDLFVTQSDLVGGQISRRRFYFRDVVSQTEFYDQSRSPTRIRFSPKPTLATAARSSIDSNGAMFRFSFVWQDRAIFKDIYEPPRFLINLPERNVETECFWDRNSGSSL